MRKSASGVVEMAGFTSPFAMPGGTYTPLDTWASDDGVAMAAEVGTEDIHGRGQSLSAVAMKLTH